MRFVVILSEFARKAPNAFVAKSAKTAFCGFQAASTPLNDKLPLCFQKSFVKSVYKYYFIWYTLFNLLYIKGVREFGLSQTIDLSRGSGKSSVANDKPQAVAKHNCSGLSRGFSLPERRQQTKQGV